MKTEPGWSLEEPTIELPIPKLPIIGGVRWQFTPAILRIRNI